MRVAGTQTARADHSGSIKRILVLTSCTGEKSVKSANQLTLADFQRGPAWIARREQQLHELLRSAEALYSGQQQLRLMRGVQALRASGQARVDVWIVSAGYGLVPGGRILAPYEATFNTMGRVELRAWADTLNLFESVRRLLEEPFDLGLLLLGDVYLRACTPRNLTRLGGTMLALCSETTRGELPILDELRPFVLSSEDAQRFHCGQVGLKGEVAGRLLVRVAAGPEVVSQFLDPTCDLRQLLL